MLRALRGCGLRQLVLCPGSRSGPLAVAAALLEPSGLVLSTALDERSAAFFALGLGRGDGVAAAVVTTSGTAVANLLPAAVEADYSAIPLLLLTADRPVQLKGKGANQTVNQEQFLSRSCRRLLQGHPSGLSAMEPEAIGLLACSAWEAAQGLDPLRPAGPVHLNLPFAEPLHLGAEGLIALAGELQRLVPTPPGCAGLDQPPPAAQRRGALALAQARELSTELRFDLDAPGVIVAGPWRGDRAGFSAFTRTLALWCRRTGWPLLADGLSWLRGRPGLEAIGGYDLFLDDLGAVPPVDQVLRLGPLPASRRLQRWLSATQGLQLLISEGDDRPLDPLGTAQRQWGCGLVAWSESLSDQLAADSPAPSSLEQGAQWRAIEARTQQGLDQCLSPGGPSGPTPLSEPAVARQLSRWLPEGVALMLASSSPVRDWESFADPLAPPRRLYGFRGASGIDGTLSLACGLAQSEGSLVLLTGDLALLHDANGWLWQRQLRGRLTVVLIQNGGGGIFEQLTIRPGAAAEPWLDFERLFAMPQPVDPLDLAAAHGVPVRRLSALGDLGQALTWAEPFPLAVIELRTDRRSDAALRQHLRQSLLQGLFGPDRRMNPPIPPR
ncbi:2-succinyl-5-enolpyruvyl-6-hydroxy-3-cyclohexene-1-carboxylic-acid synthase [Cyanobium sp. Morenito 9A2]|nr:2-succinyl-5-enolpyruvyl-6-hydroxy-3-cyclohexene-1-carboxylic-acid synthase [Cyanobium sp. Morenito 9A2]